jgi:SpoVK/Ycf46/Vps4 family AAA+-type ATPase
MLPAEGWEQYWDRIYVPDATKRRLYNYTRFALTRKASMSLVGLPVHGIALLRGLPGTGKSSLVKGVAHLLATEIEGGILFAEVDAHALPSQMLGDSQRNTANLLERALPELAAKGHPVVALIDEVDAIATDRDRASAGTDPVDVARATEAALQGLDHLASAVENLVILATSNFPQAIDPAFLSRLDITVDVDLPAPETAHLILEDSLNEIGSTIPADRMDEIGAAVEGMSGRDIRKLVVEAALTRDPSVPVDAPLVSDDVWNAIRSRNANVERPSHSAGA